MRLSCPQDAGHYRTDLAKYGCNVSRTKMSRKDAGQHRTDLLGYGYNVSRTRMSRKDAGQYRTDLSGHGLLEDSWQCEDPNPKES